MAGVFKNIKTTTEVKEKVGNPKTIEIRTYYEGLEGIDYWIVEHDFVVQ